MVNLLKFLQKTDIFQKFNVKELDNKIVIDFITKTIDQEYEIDFKATYNKTDNSDFEVKIIKNYKE